VTHSSFPRRGVLAPLALVLVLGLGVLAVAEVTVSVREPLVLQVGERELEVRIGPERISGGERLDLELREQALVGTLDEQAVELRWTEDGVITGQVAGQPVRLTSRQQVPEPGLRVEGWFAQEPTSLSFAQTAITGQVGGCGYSLALAGNRYAGWRTCGLMTGPPTRVMLRLPEGLEQLGLPAQGALLALLLSAEALPPASLPEETPGETGQEVPSP
jgi:hypothetical protein